MKYSIAWQPSSKIVGIVGGVAAIMVLQLWITTRFTEYRVNESGRIAAENVELKEQISAIEQRVVAIDQGLKQLEHSASEADESSRAIVANVAEVTGLAQHADSDLKAITTKGDEKELLSSSESVEKADFASIIDALSRINQYSNVMTHRLDKLTKTMAERAEFLSEVPAVKPSEGWISSGFGERTSPITGREGFHKGMDIAGMPGTPVYAPGDGQVRYAGRFGGFGNYVSIVHGHGIVTKFGHMSSVAVKRGEKVKRGQLIGIIGNTGRTTGPHLHYEVWANDQPINPANLMFASKPVTAALAANHTAQQ